MDYEKMWSELQEFAINRADEELMTKMDEIAKSHEDDGKYLCIKNYKEFYKGKKYKLVDQDKEAVYMYDGVCNWIGFSYRDCDKDEEDYFNKIFKKIEKVK